MSARAVIMDLDGVETSRLLSLPVVMGFYPLCSIILMSLWLPRAQSTPQEAVTL